MSLDWVPALTRLDLLAAPVAAALTDAPVGAGVEVAEIDPDTADTAAFCTRYGIDPADSANCVVVTGRRGGFERVAACVVLATTRADVNTAVRRHLDVRKCSFMPVEQAVQRTRMEFGGITPFGLPCDWAVLVDERVVTRRVVVGSGLRRSKLRLDGTGLAGMTAAMVLPGLAAPA